MLAEDLAARLEWVLDQPWQRHQLERWLDDLARRLRRRGEVDDRDREVAAGARIELVELCRTGMDTHRPWLLAYGGPSRVLRFAGRHRVVPALGAAVRPSSPWRIAHQSYDDGEALPLALDLLGHLAADPWATPAERIQAQDELIELAGWTSISAAAALRLPVHRLDATQRGALLSVLDSLERDGGAGADEHLPTVRDRRHLELVRGVCWQAADAARLGWTPRRGDGDRRT